LSRTPRRPPEGIGIWGLEEFVEPHVRRLVAEHLGVGVEVLVPHVSLRDELAADSLDLVELAMALESEFAIAVPERILDEVRTFGDLVRATGTLIRAHAETGSRRAEPQRAWARIVLPSGESRGGVERTGWLTPYFADTIATDAMRAGRGARVELVVAGSAIAGVADAHRQFAGLGKRGVRLSVRHVDASATPSDRTSGLLHCTLSDPLLDELTGTSTAVTVTGYAGDDPWQADDLIGRAGHVARRFADGTPAEQAQALSGNGPCRFVENGPRVVDHRATTAGHHVHAHFDRRSERNGPMHDFTEIAIGLPSGVRYYESGDCTAVGPTGEVLISREASYYAQDRGERAFAIATSTTPPTLTGHPSGPRRGLRAQFDLSVRSPNGFRPLGATLDCAAADGACTLVIAVSARIGGKYLRGDVELRGGSRPTMDVRFSPPPTA
jgi:acyl carrier protein